MSWAHWIRAVLILIVVLIALVLVRQRDSSGRTMIDADRPSPAQHIDAPMTAPALDGST